jgi:hypothetical protein
MARKNILISVIGKPFKGEYEAAKYEFHSGVIQDSRFFFVPILEEYRIDKLILLGTVDSIWEKIPQGIDYEKIIIPHGNNEEDQWEIFNRINELSIEESNLYFDFTHGFRTMPFISLLSIFYFKVTMPKVRIKKVLYGNYEGRDPNTGIGNVIDLSGFLQIFDWLFAAKSFTKYGNGSELSALLRHFSDPSIKDIESAISNIDSAMQLAYMTKLPVEFERMTRALAKVDLEPLPSASPLKTIIPELSKMTHLIDFSAAEYEKQWGIADWYYKNNQVAKSIITLREAFVTYIGEVGGFAMSSFSERTSIAKEILNDHNMLRKAQLEDLSKLWKKVRDTRNAVGHPILDATETEDLKDNQRIQKWLFESQKMFSQLKESKDFQGMVSAMKQKGYLKIARQHSLDDLKAKFR